MNKPELQSAHGRTQPSKLTRRRGGIGSAAVGIVVLLGTGGCVTGYDPDTAATVKLGMSMPQVREMLGSPQHISYGKGGEKGQPTRVVIWIFERHTTNLLGRSTGKLSAFAVTFVDGKVTSTESHE